MNPEPDLRDQVHEFVDNIVRYGTEPLSWPLTHQEQVAFVRSVIFQAMKIQKTEAYMAESIQMASEKLALAS